MDELAVWVGYIVVGVGFGLLCLTGVLALTCPSLLELAGIDTQD